MNATYFHLFISASMDSRSSDFGIPSEEVRAIQAKLYEAAMKQTLALETLKSYKEHLDTDIKIAYCPHCYAEGDRFENNFYKRRQEGVCNFCIEETFDKYSEAIKFGYCQGCEGLKTEKNNQYLYVKVFGVSLLHCFMISDRNLPLIAYLQESGCNMKKQTLEMRYSPLTLAVSDNQIEIVKYFVAASVAEWVRSLYFSALNHSIISPLCLV